MESPLKTETSVFESIVTGPGWHNQRELEGRILVCFALVEELTVMLPNPEASGVAGALRVGLEDAIFRLDVHLRALRNIRRQIRHTVLDGDPAEIQRRAEELTLHAKEKTEALLTRGVRK